MLNGILFILFLFSCTFYILLYFSGYKTQGCSISIYGYIILLLALFGLLFSILIINPYNEQNVVATIIIYIILLLILVSGFMIFIGLFISLYELFKKNWISLCPIILFLQIVIWIILNY